MKRSPARSLITAIHLAGAVSALLLIGSFWLASAISELCGDAAAVLAVKRAIVGGLAVLVPALIATGATGRLLSGSSPVGFAKQKLARTKLIAATGVFVLVPCALLLARLAEQARFGPLFYALQALELAAGASNLILLAKNARQGLILSGRLRPARRV